MRRETRKRTQFNRLRWMLFALTVLCLGGLGVGLTRMVLAGTPSSGTLSPANPLITYTGGPFPVSNPSSPIGENPPVCAPGTCDEFALKVTIPAGSTTDYSVVVTIDWTDSGTTTQGAPNSDYDLYIYKSDGVTKVGQGPGTVKPEVAVFQAFPGDYIIKVVPYDVSPTVPFQGRIELVAEDAVVQPTPIPLPQATGSTPRYQIFTPPQGVLTRTAPAAAPTPAGSPAQGQPAVPSSGNGTDAGEPSIGVNWITGRVLYQSYLTTFRLTFNDSCPSSPSALWEDKSAPTSVNSLDPILFTDHGYNVANPDTGRTIVSQLAGTTSLASVTDNDGDTWIPSEGGSLHSGIDHQSLGAGPYHTLAGGLPFPKPPGSYPHAFYYCSQESAAASCSRSDDGGVTFGPSVPIYTLADCGNLHGHVKVSPDGTVYVPNNSCGSDQAVVASENNGISWQVRNIPNSGTAASDPWVTLGRGDKVAGGRVYFSYARNDGSTYVSVSDDHGKPGTWKNQFDVGAVAGITHSVFPVVIAGDDDRAAVAFLGTTAKGSLQDRAFPGVWYLFIAHTYDGGVTWTTVNATPNDPVQRGGIWLGGGSPPHRNLLDFIGIDVDKQGRAVVAYADGCTGAACVQAPYGATGNSYTQLAAIARQTGGRRLFGPDTPATTTATVPGTPYLSVGRDGTTVHLSWSESDDGGSAITNYKVLRGTTSGGETLLANAGTANKYDDKTASPNTTYYYKVVAVNSLGESCGNNETAAPPQGDSCNGIVEVTDPTGDQKGAPGNADLDVLSIALADHVEGAENKLVFKLKVADLSLLVPNRQWRIIWNYPISPPPGLTQFTGSYYVGMNSDGGVATFEYGTVSTVEAVPTNAGIPSKLGQADSGSFDPATGIITITVGASKVGNPKAGDIIGALVARTFSGNGNETVKSQSAVDTTGAMGSVNPYTGASYMVVGNLGCQSVTPPPTPSLSINDATVTEGNAGTTNATFTVTLSAASTQAVTVKYDTANGTATAGSDYQAATGTLTFNPGQTTQTINVAVTGDTAPEANETFAVNLSQPTNATISDGQGLGTITNDDQPPANTQPSLSINDVTVQEGSSGTTNAIFTVTLSAVSSQTVSVNFTTADIDATAGVDYQSRSGTLTFAPGETSKTVTVLVNGDLQIENNETFYVNLSGEVNATIARGQGTGTINNDDPTKVQFDNTTYTVAEDAGRFTITVTRTDASVDATVRYSTSDTAGLNNCDVFNNVASQRCDYEITVGTLRFAAGQTSRTITIPVIDDVYAEGNESFTLTLSSPSGVSLGTNTTATLTITDNDANSNAPNPIDTTDFFIRQHYLDFLNREPDPNGFQGWRNILNNCAPGNTSCDRIEVSSAFYRSPEFQSRGFFVYSFYVASLGRFPQYAEFMPDMSSVSGFQSQQEEEANKQLFIADFMARPEFKSRYDSKTTARAYVEELEKAAGVTLSNREELISDLEQGRKNRADVLRAVAQSPEVSVKYFNQAFVVMEYFGYLRRNPDALYQHWIDVVNGAPNDYRQMVNGFVNSAEYRSRFGKP
ncbi:MAG TPA: Calx-beta domain-containing protein [Pyrinomonadaceae bacterium]